MGFPLSRLLLISLMILPVFGLQKSQLPIANSPKGFDKQYKIVFKAYEKEFNKKMESADEKTFLKGDGYEKVSSVYKEGVRKKKRIKKYLGGKTSQSLWSDLVLSPSQNTGSPMCLVRSRGRRSSENTSTGSGVLSLPQSVSFFA